MGNTWSPGNSNSNSNANSNQNLQAVINAMQPGSVSQGYYSPTDVGETPLSTLETSDPTLQANAWEIPQNKGVLRMPVGLNTSKPASPQDRQSVTVSVQLMDLYGKFRSGGLLSPQELDIALKMGGDIATAARKQGAKNAKGAQGKAMTEIAASLHKLVGITPDELDGKGLDAPLPKSFVNILQNSGYGVTQKDTLATALSKISGTKAQVPLDQISSGMTVQQYISSLGQMSSDQISQLQKALYGAHMYDPAYYETGSGSKAYSPGNLDAATILAFRTAIMHTAEQNLQGHNVSLEQVLGGNIPLANGLGASAPAGAAAPAVSPDNNTVATPTGPGDLPGASSASKVKQETPDALQHPLIEAFTSALGRAPSQQELQAFTNSYNQNLQDASAWAIDHNIDPAQLYSVDYQSGIPYIMGAPTVTNAATAFAQNTNPTEYQGNNVLGAFDKVMSMIQNGGKVSASG